MEIAIVEYGLGNPGSILNMLKYLDMDAVISNDHKEIKNADKLILPGVGAFDNGIINLRETGLLEVLNEKVLVKKTPILGICLGMQLMALQSEEGILNGLGWINATVKRFTPVDGLPLKIPHTGWNKIEVCRANPITDHLEDESRNKTLLQGKPTTEFPLILSGGRTTFSAASFIPKKATNTV